MDALCVNSSLVVLELTLWSFSLHCVSPIQQWT